jgi:hypothetical protein
MQKFITLKVPIFSGDKWESILLKSMLNGLRSPWIHKGSSTDHGDERSIHRNNYKILYLCAIEFQRNNLSFFFVVLGIELKALYMLGKYSIIDWHSQPFFLTKFSKLALNLYSSCFNLLQIWDYRNVPQK